MTATAPNQTPIYGALPAAAPFAMSLLLIPVLLLAAWLGGWALLLPPLASWGVFSILDASTGNNDSNADPLTDDSALRWHKRIVQSWFALQFLTVFGLIWAVTHSGHLSGMEMLGLFAGVGILSGTIGITYAHELMHQPTTRERWLADLQMASVLYGHFRTEHLLVHHIHVGTPRDPVTARYGESAYRFVARVLPQSFASALKAEADQLARRKLPAWHRKNPFWRYGALQLGFLVLAIALGGWLGLALFLVQAASAVIQLEVVNYVEHYGLRRRKLPSGKYEHTQPHHSWNASPRASNWLLINLQRHSDHHFKPARRFPLLQTYEPSVAPQLPFGYPVMTLIALCPPLWHKMMTPRLLAWRERHYPDARDWTLAPGE